MKISVLTSFYNGDLMIPFFLNHYSYADEIIVAFNDGNKDMDDSTALALSRYPNVLLRPFRYPVDKIDYAFAIEHCNQIVSKLDSDWAIVVSADELIFPIGMQDVRTVLRNADEVIINTWLWWVYRNRTDRDLDPTLPAIWQRRHGCPDRSFCGCVKPAIVRPAAGIAFSIGGHNCSARTGGMSNIRFDGAHWLNADLDIAIQRRMRGRRERVSKRSLDDGMGSQHFDITEEAIRAECNKMLDSPQLF